MEHLARKRRQCCALMKAALVVAMMWASAGCDVRPGHALAASAQKAESDTAAVAIDSVSYRHDRSMNYTLLDLSQNPPVPIGGSIVDRLASGGDKGCCLNLPHVWRPGLKVRVSWHESDREQIHPETYVRDLEIPRYERPTDLYVVFYPGHEVEVVVSEAEPGHPEWKGRLSLLPWEHCVKERGEKSCKDVLPKYGGASPREMQGHCRWLQEQEFPKDRCEAAIAFCVRFYEDEEYCRTLLWEAKEE